MVVSGRVYFPSDLRKTGSPFLLVLLCLVYHENEFIQSNKYCTLGDQSWINKLILGMYDYSQC
eukprot:jgi/Psemu1/308999/fgenesh1_kg.464_\